MKTYNNPETIVLHAGHRSDPTTGAVAVPIYQTTSFQFAHKAKRIAPIDVPMAFGGIRYRYSAL